VRTMKTDLPARPDLPFRPGLATPKKRHLGWIIAGSVVGGLIVLGAIGSAIDSGESGTRVASPDPVTITEPDGMTRQEAMSAAVPLMEQAATEIGQITETSSATSDVVHLNRAADLTDDAAALFVGIDDAQHGYLTSAADHLRGAANAVSVGDWSMATDEMNAFTDDIDAATAAI